jgi:CHAT domain-containing protein/Flp pilus assembly protein TadD
MVNLIPLMSSKARVVLLAAFGTLLSGQSGSAPALALMKTAAGTIAPGQVVRYSITVPITSFFRLAVNEFQVPARVTLRDSAERVLKELSPVPNLFGAFELTATLRGRATYTLEMLASPVSSSGALSGPGAYEIQTIELNPAGARAGEMERASDRLNRLLETAGFAPRGDSALRAAVTEVDPACGVSDETRCKARAAFIKGLFLDRINRFDDARREFGKATEIAGSVADSYLEGVSTDALVHVLSELGDFRAGVDLARKALDTSRRAGSSYLTSNAHTNLCGMLAQRGRTDEALEECRSAARIADANHLLLAAAAANVRIAELLALRGEGGAEAMANSALQIFRNAQDWEGQAYALEVLAGIRLNRGDFQGALDAENQASPFYPGDPRGQSVNLRGLGTAYARMGQVKLAESHYEKAAELSRSVHDQAGEALTLLAFGLVKQRRGDIQGSLELYRRGLELSRNILLRPQEAEAFFYIGRALVDLKDLDQATENYRHALDIYREIHDLSEEGHVLGTLGGIARSRGDYATALEYYRQGLQLKQQTGDFFQIAISKMAIGAVLRSQGKLEEARTSLREAVQDIEAQRRQIVSPNLRMTYFDGVQRFYEEYIDLLMEMHRKDPDAGYDREAFQISESARARVLLDNLPGLRDVIPRELAERERQIRSQIDAAKDNPKASPADLDILQAQYEQLYDQARSSNPWYAAGYRAPVLSSDEAAQRLLDDRTILVEYKVCAARSFVFVISRNEIHTKELKGRAALRKAIAALLQAEKLQTVDADEQFWKAGRTVSQELIAPIADHLNKERIVLVADDVLQELPFGGLPWPENSETAPPSPLIERFEIVTLPSASAAAAARAAARPRTTYSKDIAVFADPVFGAARVRVRVTGESAEALRKMIPAEKISVFAGPNASVEKLKSAHLEDYRVVYFATHAEIDTDRPEVSGIVLSDVDAAGRPQSGVLRILDIYQLHIEPDLVVLGDCNSAEGTNRAGEGLVTFARAFLFAGARRVIATLWPVEPVRAMGVTTTMFPRLLGSQHLSPSAALRQTQLSLWRTGISPRHWSAFIVIGDWD